MQDLLTLYRYIQENYSHYQEIEYTGAKIVVTFYTGFEMEIRLQGLYNLYFNGMLYYSIDWQDIKDTIDDFLTDQYVFCQRSNKIRVVKLEDFHENTKCNHAWTIQKKLR